MKRKIFLSLIFIFAASFLMNARSAQASGPTYINRPIMQPAHWTKEGSPYVVTNMITVNAPLEIDPGVIVKFPVGAGLAIKKSFSAIGTPEEKIIFTSLYDDDYAGDTDGHGDASQPKPGYWRSLTLYGSEKIALDNVIVRYGSSSLIIDGSISIRSAKNVSITNTEIRYAGYSGLYIEYATPLVENCLITESKIGVLVENKFGQIAKISKSSIINNTDFGAATRYDIYYVNDIRLDARNNWWGDESGPYYKHKKYGEDNLDGKGNSVSDGIMFDPWLKNDSSVQVREPIVLVPGIGASINPDIMIGGIMNDNWTLFSHTYDGIIEAFKEMGYEEDKDFFIAYYDWRQKNEDSARDYLKPLINKVLNLSDASKVNIVAHSMGGLVARSYIQSDDYDNDVDNLFLIGTPNRGSSDVYPVWEGGYIPKNWDTKIAFTLYLNYLNAKKLTFSSYESIHKYVPSIKQLMPIYSYIYPKENPQNLKNYSTMNELNNWLENLNNGISELNDRVRVSVISGKNQYTTNGIPVIDINEGPLWIDGKPDPLDPERNDTSGDGRVLLSSSNIQSLFNDILNYNHGDIVSQSEQIIASRINEELNIIHPAPDIPNELGFWFASPVDVEITDPEGRKISGDVNDIPLAKYAAESNPDGFKIVSIPNPVNGEYKIMITGNGEGEFHIGSEYLDYEDGNNDQSSLIGGVIQEGNEKEYMVEYNSDDPGSSIAPIKITLETITSDLDTLENLSHIYSKEANFLQVKLKVINQLMDRIEKQEEKEGVIENYEEQINRQIDWLISYISEKSDKKAKGEISEFAKTILSSDLEFIKY